MPRIRFSFQPFCQWIYEQPFTWVVPPCWHHRDEIQSNPERGVASWVSAESNYWRNRDEKDVWMLWVNNILWKRLFHWQYIIWCVTILHCCYSLTFPDVPADTWGSGLLLFSLLCLQSHFVDLHQQLSVNVTMVMWRHYAIFNEWKLTFQIPLSLGHDPLMPRCLHQCLPLVVS